MQDGPIRTLHLSHQEFCWVLGSLRQTALTLLHSNIDTDGLGARDVFTDAGVLEPASCDGIINFADRLNAGQYATSPKGGFVGPTGEALPQPVNKQAFNAKLFEQVLDEITAKPKIWDQHQARYSLPCCFLWLVARKVKRDIRYPDARITAAILLNLSRDAVEYLYQYTRTLADFKAFLACDGVPPVNWRDAEGVDSPP